jgi:hypothetical protein
MYSAANQGQDNQIVCPGFIPISIYLYNHEQSSLSGKPKRLLVERKTEGGSLATQFFHPMQERYVQPDVALPPVTGCSS